MNRILFVITSFGCGGINRALQNLLAFLSIKNPNFELDIFVLNPKGQYENVFNKYNVFKLNKCGNLILSNLNDVKGLEKIKVFFCKILNRLSKGNLIKLVYKKAYNDILKRKYNSIIAFSENSPTYFVSGLNHLNKTAWIHCDFYSYLNYSTLSKEEENKIYSSFKKIINVSEFTNQSFINLYPQYKDCSIAIHNLMNTDYMKKMSLEHMNQDVFFNFDGFKIVTIGRIDPVKNQSIIPDIAYFLKNKNLNFKWYVIGPTGNYIEFNKLEKKIENYSLQDQIILLGEQKNPYPFIAKANLLVNTSESEACPYIINEAKILATPVLCRNFGSSQEFIENNIDGFIRNKEDFAETIEKLMTTESSKLKEVKEKLKDFEYDNEGIIQKIITNIF